VVVEVHVVVEVDMMIFRDMMIPAIRLFKNPASKKRQNNDSFSEAELAATTQ
jgi:hypothetical protein